MNRKTFVTTLELDRPPENARSTGCWREAGGAALLTRRVGRDLEQADASRTVLSQEYIELAEQLALRHRVAGSSATASAGAEDALRRRVR